MTLREMEEIAVSLDALLHCLATINPEEDPIVLQGLPRSIGIAREYSYKLIEALIDNNVTV